MWKNIVMRDVYLDNFKFILITSVIVGHTVEPILGRFEWAKSIYVFLYLFHIPMFAYVSGAVSLRKIDNLVIKGILKKLIIPYLMLEVIYSLFDFFVFSKDTLNVSPLIPYWIMWYMFSLILWRFLLPIFDQLKYPIIFATLAGLACGINNYGYNLSFSRTFVFFPFFLIGHYFHPQITEKLKNLSYKKVIGSGIIISILLLIFIVPEANDINLGWLYGSRSYSYLKVSWEIGVVYRSVIYILSFILGISVLSITLDTLNICTKYGRDSLYIYVLHGFVMKCLIAADLHKYINDDYKVIVLMLASLSLLPILSSRFAKFIGDNMMNPIGTSSKLNIRNLIMANK